eukprot:scaffold26105_cov117-Phaeocystis_antarctica.AAC.2
MLSCSSGSGAEDRPSRRHGMPVARSEQGLATIHDSVWRARIAPACPHDHESCGDQDPCLERTGIPTGPIWPKIL